jgi:hypothetical protein
MTTTITQFPTSDLDSRRWFSRILAISFSLMAVLMSADRSIAQLATWTGNGDGVSYSDPANWSGGVVPINSGSSSFNVLVPDGTNINFNVSGSISGISFGTGGSINVSTGVNFNVNSVASLGSSIFANGANTSFTANGVGVALGNNVRTVANDGAVISTSATSYNRTTTGNLVVFHANGLNSQIQAMNMTSISNSASAGGSSGGGATTYLAENGGLIDLSNLSTISGGYRDNVWANETSNVFTMRTGGNINLDNLQTITGINFFNFEVPQFSFPSLTSVQGSTFTIPNGSVLNSPSLLEMSDSTINFVSGGSLNAPNLSKFTNSSVTLQTGVDFNTATLTEVNNSRFTILAGTSLTLGNSGFTRTLSGTTTAFRASGNGAVVHAPLMSAIANTAPTGGSSGGGTTTFIAENGGLLDFSAVTHIDGGRTDSVWGNTTRNVFTMTNSGVINFNSLQSVTEWNTFNIHIPTYSLPSLTSGSGVQFNLAVGTTFETPQLQILGGDLPSSATLPVFSSWQAGQLTSLNDTTLTINVGGALIAPNLITFRNSSVTIQPGAVFNSGTLTDIDNSRIAVQGGSVLSIGASTYTRSLNGNSTALMASGVGSLIDANSITTIGNTSSGITTFATDSGGVIRLMNLNSISGGSNIFSVSTGGKIEFGNIETITSNNQFLVNGPNSSINFQRLVLGEANNSSFQASNLGRIEVSGDLQHRHNLEANFNFDNGRIVFANTDIAEIEIAGENKGLSTNGLQNFGFQQLTIGNSLSPTTLVLADKFDNGNRIGNQKEVQYLLDVNGNGLVINSGSRLVLNGHEMFISNGQNSFFSARSLIQPGQVSAVYGAGFISLTGDVGQVMNGNFEGQIDVNALPLTWNPSIPASGGGVRVVNAPTPGNPNNKAVEIYAGSMVELAQQVSTFESPFLIEFEAWAQDSSGSLSLLLDDVLLGSWSYSELGNGEFLGFSVTVEDPALRGLIDTKLAFQWDANSGHRVWLDNISMTAVPEPGTGFVLLLASLLLPLRRRRGLVGKQLSDV